MYYEHFTQKFTSLNCRGTLLELSQPQVMGILNVTPDSFSDGGLFLEPAAALKQCERMLQEGAAIIDIGAASSRPGAKTLTVQEEWERLEPILTTVRKEFPDAILSIDTWQAELARRALDQGAHIINDISGGLLDKEMIPLIGSMGNVPYICMHMQGKPESMQTKPEYEDIMLAIWDYFVERVKKCRAAGIVDIVLDPGFGFGKTQAHNYELLAQLNKFKPLDLPMMIGISRKSMLYRLFETEPGDVLAEASALHLHALQQGVRILRVHDVQAACRAAQLFIEIQRYTE